MFSKFASAVFVFGVTTAEGEEIEEHEEEGETCAETEQEEEDVFAKSEELLTA